MIHVEFDVGGNTFQCGCIRLSRQIVLCRSAARLSGIRLNQYVRLCGSAAARPGGRIGYGAYMTRSGIILDTVIEADFSRGRVDHRGLSIDADKDPVDFDI